MTSEREKQAKAEAFLARETEQYRKNLEWLQSAIPESFFSEIGEENALLVAHCLVGFDLQDYYAEINLRNAAIVICLNNPDADLQIYSKYQSRDIITMQVFLSEKPLIGIEKHIRIAVVFFGELFDEELVTQGVFEVDRRFWKMLNEPQKQILCPLVDVAASSYLIQAEVLKG